MSIKKSLFAATMGTLLMAGAALAELEVKPYGAAQYRLRLHHESFSIKDGDNYSTLDYSNRMCLRVGLRAKWDDQFSMQFQIGNDWGAAENVSYEESFRTGANLYMQLAFFRWNPGSFFLEAGIVPINGHGALDLMERSLNYEEGRRYDMANFSGWGDNNNSLIGVKFGLPISKEGVKVGAEITQSIIESREQNNSTRGYSRVMKDSKTVTGNPAAVMTVLQIPVDAGAFKITPEAVVIFNREVDRTAGEDTKTDHEMAFGAAGSFKVNDGVTVTFRGGYAMYDNGNTTRDAAATEEISGLLVGAGASVKAGPGTLQLAVDYNAAENDKRANKDLDDPSYLYTDLRYAVRVHPRVTVTPRYRTYTRMFDVAAGGTEQRFGNRFEAIIEGSF